MSIPIVPAHKMYFQNHLTNKNGVIREEDRITLTFENDVEGNLDQLFFYLNHKKIQILSTTSSVFDPNFFRRFNDYFPLEICH